MTGSSRMWIAATEKTIVHDLDLHILDIKQKRKIVQIAGSNSYKKAGLRHGKVVRLGEVVISLELPSSRVNKYIVLELSNNSRDVDKISGLRSK